MSKISISGAATGTATFTIESPATNTNRTLTLPDNTGTIITTAGGAAISGTTGSFSGDLSFNSGFGSVATAYGCRAWVNFNGTGTVAIRASGNVSSITDNGTGDYTVNFTTAMPDANYAKNVTGSFIYSAAHSIANTDVNGSSATEVAPTTSAFRFICSSNISGTADPKYVSASVFR